MPLNQARTWFEPGSNQVRDAKASHARDVSDANGAKLAAAERRLRGDAGPLEDDLGDLDRVERSALVQVVAREEERETVL
jgi:hypothetical protein